MVKQYLRFKKLKHAVKQVGKLFRSEVIVLLYHRIAETDYDPQLLCVNPGTFRAHLEYLRQSYKVISLSELVRALNRRKLPRRAVVITFDDGYADNLCNGKPLLEEYKVPATVFVTAGYIGQKREFWWDELGRILLSARELPEELNLDINGKILQWRLGRSARDLWSEEEGIQGWSVLEKTNPTVRHGIYRELCTLIRPMPIHQQNAVLSALRSWAGILETGRADRLVMTEEGLRDLAATGLIEIGAHTMTHQHLSAQPLVVQREEIFGSKTKLESITGFPVNSFAYPFGGTADYSYETVQLVRTAGYTSACSNFPKKVNSETSRFELPRFLVRDWPAQAFVDNLEGWFSG